MFEPAELHFVEEEELCFHYSALEYTTAFAGLILYSMQSNLLESDVANRGMDMMRAGDMDITCELFTSMPLPSHADLKLCALRMLPVLQTTPCAVCPSRVSPLYTLGDRIQQSHTNLLWTLIISHAREGGRRLNIPADSHVRDRRKREIDKGLVCAN